MASSVCKMAALGHDPSGPWPPSEIYNQTSVTLHTRLVMTGVTRRSQQYSRVQHNKSPAAGRESARQPKGSRLNCRRRRQSAAAAILRAAAVAHKAHDAEGRRTGRPEGCAASQAGTARAQQQQMPLKLSAHSEVSRSHGDAQVERHHLPARRRPPCHRFCLQ